MPAVAAPEINREAVRVLALAVGVREAARRMGLSQERVMKWSQRGNWQLSADASAISKPSATGATKQLEACPQPVRNPAEALLDALADDSHESKISLSRGLRKAAKYVEDMEGADIIESAQNVKATAQSLALVHKWDTQAPSCIVNVAFIGGCHTERKQAQVVENQE
jgi:hypothetical protein